MRMGSQPVSVGFPENPWPGKDGITRWKASAALAPCSVGLVSGSMILSCSIVEPGHPCVTMSGKRVLVLGANVDEVDVDPVDLGDEVREGGKALLELAPVVIRRPVAGQCLDRLELHALGGIHLPVGPLRRVDAIAQVLELLLGDVDRELADVLRGG